MNVQRIGGAVFSPPAQLHRRMREIKVPDYRIRSSRSGRTPSVIARCVEAILAIEGNTDPIFIPPDRPAVLAQSVGLQCKREAVRDANGAGYVKHCPEVSHVADHAVNCTAVELNRSGFQNPMANGSAFLHQTFLWQKPPPRLGSAAASYLGHNTQPA